MQTDLEMNTTVFDLGIGIFYVGYVLFEVPSNLLLRRMGARRWIARIVISWGLVIALPISIPAALLTMPTDIMQLPAKPLLGLVYVGLIPFSWLAYRRQVAQDRRAADVVPLRAVESEPQGN